MVQPLMQQIADAHVADLWVVTATVEIRGRQAPDEPQVVSPCRAELVQHLRGWARTVMSRARHSHRVPGQQMRLRALQKDADTARKAAMLGLDEVPQGFLHAPLLRRWMPAGDVWRQRGHL